MRYQLAKHNDLNDIKGSILLNRGVKDPEHFLNTTPKDICHYSKLSNINEAYDAFAKAVADGVGFGILVDPDPDGNCSAAIIYQVLRKKGIEPRVYIHEGKGHGLTDQDAFNHIIDDVRSGRVRCLIVPDGGTSDASECRTLLTQGCTVIVLDHHEPSKYDKKNTSAIVVNPHLSEEYPNKYLSGAGVVWQFIRKIDDEEWTSYADEYTDLAAFSIVADHMDCRTLENKEIIRQGLSNIKNLLLQAMFKSKEQKTNGETNPTAINWYVNPALNGIVRVGSMEEKELMFRAFCQLDEEFEHEKRGGVIETETIYERVARLATNAKSRQDRLVDKEVERICADLEAKGRHEHSVIFTKDEKIDEGIRGFLVQKIATRYNKPSVLLVPKNGGDLKGSLRNCNRSPILDFAGFLRSLDCAKYVLGHANAAGIGFTSDKMVKEAIRLCDERLAGFTTPIYEVDFKLTPEQLDRYVLRDLHEMREHYANEIPEALIFLESIRIKSSDIVFMGKVQKNTWKFSLGEDFEVIKFQLDETDEFLKRYERAVGWDDVDDLCLNLVVTVTQKEFAGKRCYQLICKDYEIVENI